jgi:hypothetical protein
MKPLANNRYRQVDRRIQLTSASQKFPLMSLPDLIVLSPQLTLAASKMTTTGPQLVSEPLEPQPENDPGRTARTLEGGGALLPWFIGALHAQTLV